MSKKHTTHHKQKTHPAGADPAAKPAVKPATKPTRKAATQKKLTWPIILGLVVVAAVAAVVTWPMLGGSASSALASEISVQQAYQKYQDGAFVLDVRTQEEWNEYHAPNTTLIPLDQLASRVSELPKDQEIVVVCRSGNRSQEGRDILLKAGFTHVSSMAGGLKAWQTAGYPTVSGP